MDWLRQTFGAENIVAATLHADEETPHIHATVVPIVQGERSKAKHRTNMAYYKELLKATENKKVEEAQLKERVAQLEKKAGKFLRSIHSLAIRIWTEPSNVSKISKKRRSKLNTSRGDALKLSNFLPFIIGFVCNILI